MVENRINMKRLPAVEKKISDIRPGSDVRIRILGAVINCEGNTIVVDDGSGKVEILFENSVDYLKSGQFIRVVTRIIPMVDGFECRGECVQMLENFDISLYKDTKKIIKGD